MEIALRNSVQIGKATVIGCAVMIVCSYIRIPFHPVPFTLQTFGLFVLGLTQTPRQALYSLLAYLICATLGLPVMKLSCNPLWFTGKCAGYLISFPMAAWVIAKLSQKYSPALSLLAGQAVIYLFGFCWLVPFIGIKMAWAQGVFIFLGPSILKAMAAIHFTQKWRQS